MDDTGLVTLVQGDRRVQVAPACGGSISRFWSETAQGAVEWLRPATEAGLRNRDPLDMGSFPLVPFCNRIRDGRFTFGGRTVELPLNFLPQRHTIHGHGWKAPWRVGTVEPHAVELHFQHPPGDWPWRYVSWQRIELDERGLVVSIGVRNEDTSAMPAGIGHHPYFPRTPHTTIRAKVEKVWLTDAEVMPTEHVPPPPHYDLNRGLVVDEAPMDNNFTGWDGTGVIEWPERRARLTMTAPPLLRTLVVYIPRNDDHFCFEPTSHSTDAFNLAAAGVQGTGMAVLQPGESLSSSFRMDPEFLP